jgi:Cu(I)/Ag(I) efflux system membrane protein CusA/SilA
MIAKLIRWSITNRFLVLLATLMVTAWGVWSLYRTPLDAIPDLSDVQVIIRTTFPGQAPQIVENQITYPLTTTMLSVPGAKAVRGYSMFGDSFVYILFEDGTDPYWARSRVLEYLNQVQSRLPAQAKASLGPDATGVGWVYEYALIDRTGKMDLSQLRALQDWFLKYELKAVPDVSEVASVGGMVRQYQILLDQDRIALQHPRQVIDAVRKRTRRLASVSVERSGAQVRSSSYLQSLDDFARFHWRRPAPASCCNFEDVAHQIRRRCQDRRVEQQVGAGGIIVMRSGRMRWRPSTVKAKLEALNQPTGVGYDFDRSNLIRRVDNLQESDEDSSSLLVCLVFLLICARVRSCRCAGC